MIRIEKVASTIPTFEISDPSLDSNAPTDSKRM